ncbi:MAG: hypothetical protein B7Y35_07465 [Sphingomonadales bacterium 28-64-96]|nr:MAG: hypothetical protein B7Y35_07465 [Sphingomonadales bacterium 28-64-96]
MSFSTGGLFLNESVAIAQLYAELGDWAAVKIAAAEAGVIPFRKEASVSRTLNELINRLEVLTSDEISLLCSGERHDQLNLLWLALCRGYRFIGEFAAELISERYLSFRTLLGYDDFDAFYAAKAEWEPRLEKISASTKAKLRQILFRMMREAGVLDQNDHICRALLSSRLSAMLLSSNPADLRYFPGAELDARRSA